MTYMKITDVKTILLTGPCTYDPWLSECRRFRGAAFIEIHTDSGLIGIGETYNGYRCAEIIPGTVDYFKPILVGQPIDDVNELFKRMYYFENFWCRTGHGLSVLNGIEAACPNTVTVEVAPAYGPLHSLVIGDSLQIQEGRILPPEKPGLGVEVSDDVKNRFPFIPGSGEFNGVEGKMGGDFDDRTAELVDTSKW